MNEGGDKNIVRNLEFLSTRRIVVCLSVLGRKHVRT